MSRYARHPAEVVFADLELEHRLATLRDYWAVSFTSRAERNKLTSADPDAWRAAEMELRRHGEFERAVHCQRVADELEEKR